MGYIIDFEPFEQVEIDNNYYEDIEKKISLNKSITQNDAENFFRTISYLTRKAINPNMDNFDNKCDLAQSILGHYLEEINCKVYNCATHTNISPTIDGHSFTMVTINVEGEERNYLLDPTYIQFFKKERCHKGRYLINPKDPTLPLLVPDPGYFIQEEDKDAAEFLLRYGYIEMTEDYAKMYGDSFYNADRRRRIDPYAYESLPGDMYISLFKKGKEKLSTSRDELSLRGQLLPRFNKAEYSPHHTQ